MKRLQKLFLLMVAGPNLAYAHTIETVTVEGRQTNLVGVSTSASEGLIGQKEMEIRPLLRTGEVLELVPGMVATQHSGTGKANQYFLRGFNLDHGTDFSTSVDGMPVNMRTHGHGQGYTDLNFLIPETVSQLAYKKGAYYADVGDFSGAGSAEITTFKQPENNIVDITAGEYDYYRLFLMSNIALAGGNTLFAVERNDYDGPWSDIEEDVDKTNVLIKHTTPLSQGHMSVAFMTYDNQWNSADQIPSRAVEQGIIDELGSLDNTLGGESSRYSLNANWEFGNWQGSAYIIDYDLNLWSNFTYFLDDETNGDQFEQVDDRVIYGGHVNYSLKDSFMGKPMENRFGIEWRVDDIDETGLYQSQARQRRGVIRSDQVKESSIGVFWENKMTWTDQLHSVVGIRSDYYDFEVDDQVGTNTNGIDLSTNNGNTNDDITSLKGSLIYTFNSEWESYISVGQGFHSNDARGTTTRIDPSDGSLVETVDPLVRSFGYEMGIRGFISDKINTSLSLWTLELDSELLFVGDAGNTEASRRSERNGFEITAYYHITEQWSADVEYAYTDAKFTNSAPEGDNIPGAIESVFQAGLNADFGNSWFGSLRVRHFGERPLIEDGTVKSDPSTIWNLRVGYHLADWTFKADILNLTDSDDHDIDYFYASRLNSESSGQEVEDIHYHVMEPRSVRFSVGYQF
ncbi:TonB-dependent receptor [Marinibactrum halimedae]|uniref:TonB-dependent receptor n=1 Tax=Marinibactrum halimedae TaxID=1444977 RepID=A0AA37T0V4_9GAMM|nr:TonB-dependent receptor [Marinibactrum halimedae]MCD9457832.1 TonB-dependent receptor [Marinibactrum halimedae]GLS24794.1 TonB-dependent receptor [Marinibactrum halimedae]